MSVDRAWLRVVAAVVMASGLTGCKSGASMAKPSWWTFGGTGADAEKLASAPAYSDAAKTADGPIAKPSTTATPYPTTTTPQGYVVAGSTAAAAGAVPAPQQPVAGDAPITYGTTPPPRVEAALPATPPPAASGVAQTGPYATLPTASPSSPPAPPAAAPAALEPPAARVADTRGSDAYAPPSAAQPPAAFAPSAAASFPSGTGDSRYGMAGGSRFSGDPAAAPAAGMPAAPFATPQATPPAAPPIAPPAAAAPASLPSAPPMRRPDPGYRPGGTSSYRPSKTILVGEPESAAAVRTAGFESPAEPLRQ